MPPPRRPGQKPRRPVAVSHCVLCACGREEDVVEPEDEEDAQGTVRVAEEPEQRGVRVVLGAARDVEEERVDLTCWQPPFPVHDQQRAGRGTADRRRAPPGSCQHTNGANGATPTGDDSKPSGRTGSGDAASRTAPCLSKGPDTPELTPHLPPKRGLGRIEVGENNEGHYFRPPDYRAALAASGRRQLRAA